MLLRLLLCGCLFAVHGVSHAVCEQASGKNVGVYKWNPAMGHWDLIDSYYDPAAESYSPYPGDQIVGSGWGGGGGGGYIPYAAEPTKPTNNDRSALGFGSAGIQDEPPCKLPRIRAALPAPLPSVGGTGIFRRIVNFFFTVETGVFDAFEYTDADQTPATCNSYVFDRLAHAHNDARITLAAIPRLRNVGQRIRVHYDDNGSEVWVVSTPNSTNSLDPVPLPYTLRCP